MSHRYNTAAIKIIIKTLIWNRYQNSQSNIQEIAKIILRLNR